MSNKRDNSSTSNNNANASFSSGEAINIIKFQNQPKVFNHVQSNSINQE